MHLRLTKESRKSATRALGPGAVRVSLGLASNFADAYSFAQFARSLLDISAKEI